MNPEDKVRTKGENAQSLIEYAVLLSIVAAVLISMEVYAKRGIQGNFRKSAEELRQGAFSYSPGATFSSGSIIDKDIREHTNSATKGEIIFGFFGSTNSNSTVEIITNLQEDLLPFSDEPRR